MSKLKARIDQAVAEDLGIELSSIPTTLKEVAGNPDSVHGLVMAFTVNEIVYYDLVPVWRNINGMRIKIPKFQSRPIIEDRLIKQQYQRYYTLGDGILTPLKVSKASDIKIKLPFKIGNDPSYQTTMVVTEDAMGLRKKPLLFNRQRLTYAS